MNFVVDKISGFYRKCLGFVFFGVVSFIRL